MKKEKRLRQRRQASFGSRIRRQKKVTIAERLVVKKRSLCSLFHSHRVRSKKIIACLRSPQNWLWNRSYSRPLSEDRTTRGIKVNDVLIQQPKLVSERVNNCFSIEFKTLQQKKENYHTSYFLHRCCCIPTQHNSHHELSSPIPSKPLVPMILGLAALAP